MKNIVKLIRERDLIKRSGLAPDVVSRLVAQIEAEIDELARQEALWPSRPVREAEEGPKGRT